MKKGIVNKKNKNSKRGIIIMKKWKMTLVIFGIIIVVALLIFTIVYIANKNTDTMQNIISNQTSIVDNISMTIKEATLTKTGATIVVTNNNKEIYWYGETYTIEKKQNGEWKILINKTDVIEEALVWKIEVGKSLEFKKNWAQRYGELEKGDYRFVQELFKDQYSYLEFSIK